jgi:peptide/nickel transport system substrate-binding protein
MSVKVKIVLLYLSVFALAAAGIFGCSDSKERGQAIEKRLVIGSQFDVGGSIDPRQGVGGPNLAPKLLVFEPPVYFDENYDMQPLLLTSWEPSIDAKIWTLHLRRDVRFSDGTPLNSEAIIFSVRYMTRPGSGLANIQAMDAVDAYTVRISLKKPDAIFIHTLSSLGLMSPTCVDEKGRFVKPVGTGPFRFVEYIQGQQLVYRKNEDYWGDKPKVDKVVFKIIPDFNTRAMALESGEIDVADYLPAEILQKLETDPRFTVVRRIPSPCPNWIGMNTKKEPFDDVRVRMAVNYAVDVQTIVDRLINSILPGLAVPATKGPHSQPLFQHIVNPDLQWYGYDVAKAKQLLEEAGWRDMDGDGIVEKNGRPFKVELISSLLYAEGTEIAEAVQGQLKAAGIDVAIRVLESGARFQAYREKKYDLIELGGICPHNDPSPWYEYYFHSRKHPAYCIMEDQAMDAEIDRLSSAVDEKSRKESFYRLQYLLEKKVPGIFLYIQQGAVAFRNDIKGFSINCGMTGAFSYARNAYK